MNLLQLQYYTPDIKRLKKNGFRKVALMRLGEWEEIYPHESMIADISNDKELRMVGMVPVKKPIIHRTIKEARKHRGDFKLRITE